MIGEGDESKSPDVQSLTVLFFILYLLTATQDIAVDGWALTMLSRANVAHASTCNSVGQTAGYFIAFAFFMAFNSAEFCNSYLRTEPAKGGMLTLSQFMQAAGVVFLITTVLVAFLKKERKPRPDEMPPSIKEAFLEMATIIKDPNIISMSLVMVTCKVGFAAVDAISGLKLIESGVPKERMGLIAVVTLPFQIVCPVIIGKYMTSQPMSIWVRGFNFRLVSGLVLQAVVWLAKTRSAEQLDMQFYGLLVLVSILHSIAVNMMFVSQMALFAKISDPTMGGTYMTLLNTITNLGAKWPTTLVLYLMDFATIQKCKEGVEKKCDVQVDGFDVLCGVCIVLGLLWKLLMKERVAHLEKAQHFSSKSEAL